MSAVSCLVERDGDGALDGSLRAITLARGLAGGRLTAVLDGPASEGLVADLSDYGVTRVVSFSSPSLTGWAPRAVAAALKAAGDGDEDDVFVAAGTEHGNEVLAHLAAASGAPFVASCTEASRREDGSLALVRQRWGGSLIEHAVLLARGGCLGVASDAVPAVPAPRAEPPVLEESDVDLTPEERALAAVESREQASGTSLASAKVVVSGGRGIGGPEGFAVIEELAGLLGGAVGVSRAVTSLGWRPHREQVGQTGTRVTPDLYLACGISGAIQHLAGCQAAKHMIAINTDPDAPIMSRADYAVIGDAGEVLTALLAALRER